ncbi:MAG: AMP-dependent synthetase [Myxococcales bacterium]|nr:AMP-dependent synthetase [Myxococcales bacterium]
MNVSQVSLLHEYLERNGARHPEKTALIFQQRRLTWGEVDGLATQVATVLRSLGVARGDRVVIYLDNCVETCVSIFGILRADAIFSVINPQTKPDKLVYMLNDCRAKVIITDQLLDRIWREALPQAPHLQYALIVDGDETAGELIGHVLARSFEREVATASADRPATRNISRNIPIDLAAIIYTSGSTGDPKGVMLTHHNMVSAAESITTYLENRAEDIVLSVLPLSFDYGLYQWLMVNQYGGTLVLEQSFNYPAAVLKLVETERITGLPVVPTIASLLKTYDAKGLRLPGIRYVTNTAAALAGSHIETLKRICPNARIFSMYGLTECKRVCYLPPEEIDRRPDSVGRAMPNMEVYIGDPEGRRLPPNTVGELVVRGPHVMKGYWEKPAETAERLKPGDIPGEFHLWTGDYFKMDDEGFLYFIGRRDDIIKSRGEKVSPKEVENVLYALPGVQDAAVVGVPDEVLGQAIRAYLVLVDGQAYTSAQVIHWCVQRLESFLVPKYVTFLSSIPKTSSGKITKKHIDEFARRAFLSGDPL